ncbi:AMP-dependent synthetase/ligase [Rothia halotolerans]|uniref:AMP-dependent synthetase/ligase n=1 Tax=Rothia halotolerans TaxID=405770 RepID=UPI00101CE9F5|nr:AMP-dependent synthetase/ligase [Rothia halotolerans]
MQETAVELPMRFDPEGNVTDLLEQKVRQGRDPMLFKIQDAPGSWRNVTAAQFHAEVTSIAKGLLAEGLAPGDPVGLMSRTRYEWAVLDFAVMYAGGVVVPVYETSSPSQVAWNLTDSGAARIFVETKRHAGVVRRAVEEQGAAAERIWRIDAEDSEEDSLDALRRAGHEVSDERLERARSAAGLEDVATIIYTSGTTGRPKGCELTHGNFVRLSGAARLAIPEVANGDNSTLLFLPLAHVFARYIHVLCIDAEVTVGHSPDVAQLVPDIASFSPDFLLVVPRLFEKIYNGARSKAHEASSLKGRLFDMAERTGVEWSTAVMSGRRVPPLLAARYRLFDRLVFSKLRAAMGGRARYAVSGGSPLSPRLGHFFHSVGIKILEGYGLTETTAPATVGTVKDFQIGTVGPPLPGTAVRIDEDGEVLVRGVGVFHHYRRNEQAEAEAFTEDGWFRTGDLGELTDRGMLRITGRKKEMIVTAGGKNVSPSTYEDVIRSSPLVSQCVVVGDNRPFIAALITLDEETLPKQLSGLGLDPGLDAAQAAQRPEVREAVQELIDRANETVSKAESVRAFRIIPQDFTEESGHLTPSMKIRRPRIVKDYAEVIEEIYSSGKPGRTA